MTFEDKFNESFPRLKKYQNYKGTQKCFCIGTVYKHCLDKTVVERVLAEVRKELGKDNTGMRLFQFKVCEKLGLKLKV